MAKAMILFFSHIFAPVYKWLVKDKHKKLEAVGIPQGRNDPRISIIIFRWNRAKFVQKTIIYYHCCGS